MDPTNFVNASWIINSLKVYKQAFLDGSLSNGTPMNSIMSLEMTGWIFSVVALLHLVHFSL